MRFGVFPAVLVILVSSRARAEAAAPGTPTEDRTVADTSVAPQKTEAHAHFQQALALYRAGKYHGAVAELNAALASDPSGKDLVYNLALVQEKLGDFAGAITSLERFRLMEKDPAELERAAQAIERIEGARAELIARELPSAPNPPGPLKPCPMPRLRGKLDFWVLGASGFAVASLLVGTVLGVRALSLDPRGESTGPGTSFATLRDRAERSRSAAVWADIALSTSLLAGATATALYFGRYADAASSPQALHSTRAPRVSAAWLELRF